MRKIRGRPLVEGLATGELLVSHEPISFYGGVDPITGKVVEPGHPLEGESLAGKILIFPYGKGSTVGSYVILRLRRRGLAPAGIINVESEPIIVVGCMISSIPLMDRPAEDILSLKTGIKVRLVVKEHEAYLEVP